MVRTAGLEPAHLAALPPQSSVSANSTTCAATSHNEPIPTPGRKIKLDQPTGSVQLSRRPRPPVIGCRIVAIIILS